MFKLFSFIQHKKNTKKLERVCNDHDHCHVEMPNEGNKILEYNDGEKSLKAPFMILLRVFAWKNALMSK